LRHSTLHPNDYGDAVSADRNPLEAKVKNGKPFPLGSALSGTGANFSVYSSQATEVQLVLFDSGLDARADRIFKLDASVNRTAHYWHIFADGVRPGQRYGYRMDGPHNPEEGLRFNSDKLLLDPYGRAVETAGYRRGAAVDAGDNQTEAFKSVVTDTSAYDWEDDQLPQRPFSETVIYELHVGGFTKHPNSGVTPAKRGTFAGLVEKIPYLKDLGITAVELMPVFQFDVQDAPDGLTNYWGYSSVSFFAPHLAYSSGSDPLACLDEFRDMVKALHRADIEVILDVVYNHSPEGNEKGPTLSYRGLDNPAYYILSEDRSRYADFTGTGNTLSGNSSVLRRLILDSLRYWASEMHVDGFRFDLASVLSRNPDGTVLENAPVLMDIASDPHLAGMKLMAEAWDAAGLYQVGSFVGDRWKEWNGKFRDDLQGFIKGDPGKIVSLRQRLLGSPDLYEKGKYPPEQSVNFAACHDGFTLNDLVSYDHEHNEANLEQNGSSNSNKLSWNCGAEGPTQDSAVEELRNRQIRNALTLTFFSLGTPLLLMGDEVRRTQQGNSNGYCQDNEISWFDWSLCASNAALFRFAKVLIGFHKHRLPDSEGRMLTLAQFLQACRVEWHGVELCNPDISESSHSLAATGYKPDGSAFHLMVSEYWEPLLFSLPAPIPGAGPWLRKIDTSLKSPNDIEESPVIAGEDGHYLVSPRSVVLLLNTPS
jgi:isoamylase